MPRLSKTVAEKQLDALRDSVDIYMMKRTRDGVDCSTVAAALGFKYSTLRDRRKRAETFILSAIVIRWVTSARSYGKHTKLL